MDNIGRVVGRRFRIILIKPSHYDDDGYVIQWHRSMIPSNSLASVHALVTECAEAQVLGPDIEISAVPLDETNTVVDVSKIIREIESAGAGFVGLVGVQSNQFPRALDLATRFRAAGLPVVIGGFHVSGCLSMLPDADAMTRRATEMGCILFAGEAEDRMAGLIKEIHAGTPQPVYNYLADLPDMAGSTVPMLPRETVVRVLGKYSSFDAGRGCPFQCSFCTIINVQGRKSRRRTADDVEHIIRENAKQNIRRFFITDDNFARNRDWEEIIDRMIHLREVEGFKFKFILQVDTLCHKIPNFIEKCARAGCNWVFIGLENINPDALSGAKKRQNRIWEYRDMIQGWKRAGVMAFAGYILGFPGDTADGIRRDIDIIKRELPLDMLEFFILTPLPGSEDHKKLHDRGVWMDPDLNKYDVVHVTTGHDRMSKAEWEAAYDDAWHRYYEDGHIETIMRRAVAFGRPARKMVFPLVWFYGSHTIEGVHALEGGVLRRKIRTQRRPGFPIESPLTFYPRRGWEFFGRLARWAGLYRRYARIAKRIDRDPARHGYSDLAITPIQHESGDNLAMLKTYEETLDKRPKVRKAATTAVADDGEPVRRAS